MRFNNKNSIPAFSMVEAIIGMVITSIIIGIVFVIFGIVTETMLDFKSQNQLVADLNRLTYSINKDIFETEKINQSEDEVSFTGYAGETIKYHFRETDILRESETFTDTFQIKLKEMSIDSVKNKSQSLFFQKLKLKIEVNEKEMDLKFYKQVYPNELLKTKEEL